MAMKLILKMFLLLPFLFSVNTFAGHHIHIATASSDYDSSVSDIWAYVGDSGLVQAFTAVERLTKTKIDFNLRDLKKGMVLIKAMNRDVFVVKSNNFDPARGGTLILTYLKNGITGKKENLSFDVQLTGKDAILTYEGDVFKRVHALCRRVAGKVIGIKELEFKSK